MINSMFTFQKGMVRISVRSLVEFLLREGDIHSQGGMVSDVEAMQAGSRIHRKIQKEQRITYQAEVPLKMEWNQKNYRLILEGRADGIDHTMYGSFSAEEQITMDSFMKKDRKWNRNPEEKLYFIDEIKGLYQNVMEFQEVKKLHLAQAACYAAMYLKQNELSFIGVQITYCNMDTDEIKRFHFVYEKEELEEWFQGLIDSYKMWADAYVEAWNQRQASIIEMKFPFAYRSGQKKLVAMIYHSIEQKESVFFQAPTGIGKTISAIYPSIKILAEEKANQITYLTAKTITRTVAEDTLRLLRKQGLSIKSVTMTAKEKMCPNDIFECNPATCARAHGHYDRINQAMYAMFLHENIMTRETFLSYGEQYMVCPYELAWEMAALADFMICDYNYVFDPHVNRNAVQEEAKMRNQILLIDEAHNLLERSREMNSAVLSEHELKQMKKLLPKEEKTLHRKLAGCRKRMTALRKHFLEQMDKGSDFETGEEIYLEMKDMDDLYFPLFHFLDALMEYLTDHPVFDDREKMVEIFFTMRHFLGILESMTDGYRNYALWTKQGFALRLFCIDPSSQLREILDKNKAAIFFSATLLPMPYYRNLLYGEDATAYAVASPFDAKNRLICIASDVTSRYNRRSEQEYCKILEYISKNVSARKGNYMVFFPSYEMMEQTYFLVDQRMEKEKVEILLQKPMMEEAEKEEYLNQFQSDRDRSLIGFCVLGSLFSEGIDLSGERLIGVLIVGTGLPKVCRERNMIRDYFDQHDMRGFDYAYRYPGMNKVLQAAGRVIRTVMDRGVITLLDERFLWKENQYLLPEDWTQYYEVNLRNYSDILEQFWKDE